MPLKLSYHGRTDTGLVRPGNEDSLLMLPEKNLFVICDGMGGHSAGEVASRTAVGTISATFNIDSPELRDDPLLNLEEDLPPQADLLVKAIRLANRRIHNRSEIDTNLEGMGTTVVGICFGEKLVSLAHVGDSRIYVYRGSRLTPLTTDHSWVAEVQAAGNMTEETASTLVNKNIITRALGINETVEVDIRLEEFINGDLFVLCSDGLCGYASDDEIQSVVADCKKDPERTVDSLIRLANDHGGSDNVTVICVRVDACDDLATYRPKPVATIPVESISTGEREDEWLETLAESARNALEAASTDEGAESQSSGSRTFMLIAILVILVAAVAIYYFFGDKL